MVQAFQRFMRVLTPSTHGQLRAQVQHFRAENQILCSRIEGPARLAAQNSAPLVKLAKPLRSAIRNIISIVQPDTRDWGRFGDTWLCHFVSRARGQLFPVYHAACSLQNQRAAIERQARRERAKPLVADGLQIDGNWPAAPLYVVR